MTTRARLGHVWIIYLESGTHEALNVVNVCVFEIISAVTVNYHFYAMLFDNKIVLFWLLFKPHSIGQTRTSSTLYIYSQTFWLFTLLFHESYYLFCCLLRDCKQFCCLSITHRFVLFSKL